MFSLSHADPDNKQTCIIIHSHSNNSIFHCECNTDSGITPMGQFLIAHVKKIKSGYHAAFKNFKIYKLSVQDSWW